MAEKRMLWRESIIQQIENGCTILTQKANAMANIGYPDDICLAIYSYNAGEGTVSQALQNLNGSISKKHSTLGHRNYKKQFFL